MSEENKPKPQRRLFRFSLQTLLAFVTAGAALFGLIGRLGVASPRILLGFVITLVFLGFVALLVFTIFRTAVFIDARIGRTAAVWLSPIYGVLWSVAFLKLWIFIFELPRLRQFLWKLGL